MGRETWSVLLVVALWGWILSTLIFIFRAFPRRGVFQRSAALRWGTALLLFFFLWVAGLLNS